MSPGASLIWIILKLHSVMIKYSGVGGGKGGSGLCTELELCF